MTGEERGAQEGCSEEPENSRFPARVPEEDPGRPEVDSWQWGWSLSSGSGRP